MNPLLEHPVLVLNRLWQPIHTCSVRRAIKLLCLGHAQVLQTEGEARYQTHDISSWIDHSAKEIGGELVHSVSLALRIPKIIILSLYDRFPRKEVTFSRANVFIRDKFTCQYCAQTFPEKDLNLDHVVPRARGGKMNWENIVTSCIKCNTRKGHKLPSEAKMHPLKTPQKPRWRPHFGLKNTRKESSWQAFINPDPRKVQISA
ncbi:MAG: HNH endonuclease [Verrucomicrobiales bacterium]